MAQLRYRHERYLYHQKTYNLKNRIGLADIREELVPEPFTLGRTLYEPSDVDELYRRRNDLLTLRERCERSESCIRYANNTNRGVNSAKGIILCRHTRFRERIKKRRLPHVRQPHDSNFHRCTLELLHLLRKMRKRLYSSNA